MDETILLPSPNWFQVSGVAVSSDGWVVYGGPSKSLCVLEPIPSDYDGVISDRQQYHAHFQNRAHLEKIVSVDLCPEWPQKRCILAGSADGSAKQWTLEKINHSVTFKSVQSHEVHRNEKEEIVGVGYSDDIHAITVGCNGHIVKWNLNSNVVKTYSQFLRRFKPSCMACSHHIPLNVAVGTKQGVMFVLDLNGVGKILYKVRGHDEDIMNVSWCPQFEVVLNKSLEEIPKKNCASARMENIRKEHEPEDLEASGLVKDLPNDSFEDSAVVPGSAKFDKKCENVVVKTNKPTKDQDYLSECFKLKEDILKKKNQDEQSMESLVVALGKTRVDSDKSSGDGRSSTSEENDTNKEDHTSNSDDGICIEKSKESTKHIHKHLVASIGKHGGVRIWSQSGKLIASCLVNNNGNKNTRLAKFPIWPTLLWYKADVLLLSDGKKQLLQCDPLQIDSKNKLEWHEVHALHKRGLYCIASNAPRVQPKDLPANASDDWSVWTVAQDRNMIRYNLKNKSEIIYSSCGGYIYAVETCPYDANKIAISVADGAIRVWQTEMLENDMKLSAGKIYTYWQNVQGKVLTVAWHPTRENKLAFATAESRVGIIDTGRPDKAQVLVPSLNGGVYALCWAGEHRLLACAGGRLVQYRTDRPDQAPEPIVIEFEGKQVEVSALCQAEKLVCGSNGGAVMVLGTAAGPYAVAAATFAFSKMIHSIQWHPKKTSMSNNNSKYNNLLAVSSLDKQNSVVILEYTEKEDSSAQLTIWKTLLGHNGAVLQLAWNPHHEGTLMSTSQDATVRVWDVAAGVCSSVFAGHSHASLGCDWSVVPSLAALAFTGGGDCALRAWRMNQHPSSAHHSPEKPSAKKEKKPKGKKEVKESSAEDQVAASSDSKIKASKKFLLPLINKQLNKDQLKGLRLMLDKHLEKNSDDINGCRGTAKESKGEAVKADFIKMFGSTKEVHELLDKEMEYHLAHRNHEAWIMLSIFRGQIDTMVQFASQRDILCPFLISITPCVSMKFWRETSRLYLAQMDRLVARGEGERLLDKRHYGGNMLRHAVISLALHDARAALRALTDARLYKEAYMLCRTRYMDSLADEILLQWADHCAVTGILPVAAICYLALGDVAQAAATLGRSECEEYLQLAADLAKAAGQTMFADHVQRKVRTLINEKATENTAQILEQLPSRIELLMNDDKVQNGATEASDTVANGDH